MWSRFVTALNFLTILRLPATTHGETTSQDLARSFAFFPLVGLILGAILSMLALLLRPLMSPLLVATCLVTAMTILTRALHLDGLADLIDGIGGGYTPARRLEIMKDSRTGAFGAIALVLALIFKVAALETLVLHARWAPLLLVPVLSRYAMALAAYRSPYARAEGGLGKPFLEHVTARDLTIASAIALALALPLARIYAPLYLLSLLLVVLLLRRSTLRWLGGVTGDVLGAVNEIGEIVLFVLAASFLSH